MTRSLSSTSVRTLVMSFVSSVEDFHLFDFAQCFSEGAASGNLNIVKVDIRCTLRSRQLSSHDIVNRASMMFFCYRSGATAIC